MSGLDTGKIITWTIIFTIFTVIFGLLSPVLGHFGDSIVGALTKSGD